MQRFMRVLVLIGVVALFLAMPLLNLGAQTKDLKITVLGWTQTGTRKPIQDVLTPIWRQKTRVIPEIIVIPAAIPRDQWIQMQIAADTLPNILTTNGVMENGEIVTALVKAGKLYEITPEMYNTKLPLYKAYYNKLGIDWNGMYEDNLRAADRKLWFVPAGGVSGLASPVIRASRAGEDVIGIYPYAQFLRDDVLKRIYPNAKTEKELRAVLLKNGKLDYVKDCLDIPIKNFDDLYAYLKKVKALNLKAGNGKPLIPGALHQDPGIDAIRYSWGMSAVTAGMWGGAYTTFQLKGDQVTDMVQTPEWKEFIRFYNKCFNEGLIDPECFTMKPDQLNAKVANGEYAVMNFRTIFREAMKTGINEGWGLRYLPTFMPPNFPDSLETKYSDFWKYGFYSLVNAYTGTAITTTTKKEDIPQILNWVDWNCSEEAMDLRIWGLPEWSTGTGVNRRFKPAYKELEDWAVRGITGEGKKDGWYYGLTLSFMSPLGSGESRAEWNHETHGIWNGTYKDHPCYVYPKDLATADLVREVDAALRAAVDKKMIYVRINQVDFNAPSQDADYLKIKNSTGWRSQDGKDAIVKAIVGKPEDFDKNYAVYEKLNQDPGFVYGLSMVKAKWKDYYTKQLKPAIDAAAAAQGKK